MNQPDLSLHIGNKNYSSWSMRPWVLMTELGLPFQEVMVRFDGFDTGSQFKQTIHALSPAGQVPVLVDVSVSVSTGGPLVVWDTMAITEYLHERFPQAGVWPRGTEQRARARSYCAQMHAGFTALRRHCPMNIEADLREQGALIWRDQNGVRQDVAHLTDLWTRALKDADGPMLMGAFSAVDAYFSPVVMRLRRYALPVSELVQAYMDRVCALPSVAAWEAQARAEADFLAFEEPYRLHR